MPRETTGLILGGVAVVVIVAFLSTFNQTSAPTTPTDSLGRSVPASVTNDAELLLFRCGKPDNDESTESDVPRPPIVTRFITYKKAHLKFAYMPGGESKVGDPPPYKWKLIGLIDTKNNQAVIASNLEATLEKRLPCY
jgi:hypothetical protein